MARAPRRSCLCPHPVAGPPQRLPQPPSLPQPPCPGPPCRSRPRGSPHPSCSCSRSRAGSAPFRNHKAWTLWRFSRSGNIGNAPLSGRGQATVFLQAQSLSVVVVPFYGTRERPKGNCTGRNSCCENDFRTLLKFVSHWSWGGGGPLMACSW